jgi:hypothetical protein
VLAKDVMNDVTVTVTVPPKSVTVAGTVVFVVTVEIGLTAIQEQASEITLVEYAVRSISVMPKKVEIQVGMDTARGFKTGVAMSRSRFFWVKI